MLSFATLRLQSTLISDKNTRKEIHRHLLMSCPNSIVGFELGPFGFFHNVWETCVSIGLRR